MHIILETDEAWSLMTLITAYVIDRSGISQAGKQKVRRWRTDRAGGTVEMDVLAVAMNEALGSFLDEKMTRLIRRRGRYISTKELAQ
ncbi:MAG: hypothetical protein Q7T33_07690 [Dehalococcoidia bacterium]|nr:hypothetical protein [Dehalococcoidia bacterium]